MMNASPVKIWNTILFISVLIAAFVIPVLPQTWHRDAFKVVYTIIYISAVFSLEKRSAFLLTLVVVTVLAEWISGIFGLQLLQDMAKGVSVLFFIMIVFLLLRQIATARHVTFEVILGSIIGYLLMGIIYSIFLAFIIHQDPAAYNVQISSLPHEEFSDVSIPLYYGFITMTTVGYGDLVPLKPYTRSFATWVAISGQFYIAIVVALLVGKFSVRNSSNPDS